MQVITYMQADESIAAASLSTEERLLTAALEVFSREGIAKATTREIARVAGVNEVTLFRKFQNKQGLMAAVLQRAFLPGSKNDSASPTIGNGASLAEIATYFAAKEFESKRRNVALVRVLIAESHRLGEQEAEILRRIFKPWKDEMAGQFAEAQSAGMMRADLDPVIVVDQLVAMIFVGALRCDTLKKPDYAPETYLAACVETILSSIKP